MTLPEARIRIQELRDIRGPIGKRLEVDVEFRREFRAALVAPTKDRLAEMLKDAWSDLVEW